MLAHLITPRTSPSVLFRVLQSLDWRSTGYLMPDICAGDPQPHPAHFRRAGVLVCQRCGVEDRPNVHLCPPGSVHYAAAACKHCGCWLRWLPKPRTEAQQAARREQARQYAPATNAQLSFLERLGYTGPPPMSIQEASDLIERRLAERAATTATRRKRWGLRET